MKSTFHLGGDKIPYPGRDSFRSFAYLPPLLVRIPACHISDNLFCRIVLAKTLQRPESNIRVACEAGVFVCGESRPAKVRGRASFACREAIRLPDERSEEPCEARSQEAERKSDMPTHMEQYMWNRGDTGIPCLGA